MPLMPAKWRAMTLLAAAELLAMGLWFSGSAVAPQLGVEWGLNASQQSWLTMSVQLGFVIGALASALLNLPDRIPLHRLLAGSTVLGSAATAAIPLVDDPGAALLLRGVTGIALAGVYPPGMKLIATWFQKDRGLGIGILVGALALGSASPHVLNAVPVLGQNGMPPWRGVLLAAAGFAAIGAVLFAVFVRSGPHLTESAPFNWRFAGKTFTDRPSRLANFGYLGHMWELYAMWTWVPLLLIASYQTEGLSLQSARLAGFGVIAIGALGCFLAGFIADRWGRCRTTVVSLVVSGSCAVLAGFFFGEPVLLTAICLVWGFAVVADSAQFSAAVSELSDPRYVGTALTVQTSAGFLLTLITIQAIPSLLDAWGWRYVFILLAAGPVFGVWAMLTLWRSPESARMAGGNR